MEYLFIINPTAGKGRGLKYISIVEEYFKDKPEKYIIKLTEYKDHAKEIAKYYSCQKDYHIFAVGGDGTVNEVLNGMIGSNSTLSIIPCGTGNDFVKTLYSNSSLNNSIENHIYGNSSYIDIGKVNDRYYLNISSVGFDAEVVFNARKFKYTKMIPSSFAYLAGVIYTAFKFDSLELNIQIDDLNIKQNTFLLAVSNGKCYGGGIIITPEANITDGKFDICNIRKVGILTILLSIGKALKGNLKVIKEVSYHKGKTIIVSSEKDFSLNVDGELLRTNYAKFQVISEGIKVMLPTECSVASKRYSEDAIDF